MTQYEEARLVTCRGSIALNIDPKAKMLVGVRHTQLQRTADVL